MEAPKVATTILMAESTVPTSSMTSDESQEASLTPICGKDPPISSVSSSVDVRTPSSPCEKTLNSTMAIDDSLGKSFETVIVASQRELVSMEKEMELAEDILVFDPSSSQGLSDGRVAFSSVEALKDICNFSDDFHKQLVFSEISSPNRSLCGDFVDDLDTDPLCIIPLEFNQDFNTSNWILREVEKLKDCLEISCEGLEE